jgi:AAA family ATP:ADP antiporter
MSELWGTMIMTVLFWGFANEVTSVKEAGRFYAILGLGANIATIFAGQAGIFLSGTFLYSFFNIQTDRWTFSLMLISSIIIAIGLVILFVYQKLHAFLKETTSLDENEKKEREEKPKMGIRENFSYLSKSKYLICIALIVVAFNISLTLIEVVWKDQVHELYPYAADYSTYMGNVMTYIGILSTFFSVFICGQSVRRFGWTATAYITPVILLISGVLFFLFYFGKSTHIVISFAAALGTSPLVIASFLGAFQNCFSRAAKFTFFDVTKEMAFIPLSRESKLKGKAAIDGVGSRLGKSGASVIHQALFLAFGTVATSAPYVGGVVILIFFGWILAVRSLGEQFNSAKSEASLQKSNML